MTQDTRPQTAPPHPSADLARARRGDRKAFSRLVEPHRRELVAYCYRLTGALAEAEDLTQEALVRAFRALGDFQGRATPRAWLYRIAHNLCLNHVRRVPVWDSWEALAEADALGAGAGAGDAATEREDVRLGFVALVQSLPPRQRATLVLRDVLGWSAEETARILETTVPAVKNALARARQTLAARPHGADPAQVRDLAAADPAARALLADWVDAFEKGNTPRMVALLTGGKTGYNSWETERVYGKETPGHGRGDGRGGRDARAPESSAGESSGRQREERADAQRQRAQRQGPD